MLLVMFPMWLLGVAIRFVRPIRTYRQLWISSAIAALALACAVSARRNDLTGYYVVALACAMLIVGLRDAEPLDGRAARLGSWLAAFSFTTYVVHFPLLGALASIAGHQPAAHAGIAQWAEWAGWVLICLAFSFGMYLLFERHTGVVRRWLATDGRRAASLAGESSHV